MSEEFSNIRVTPFNSPTDRSLKGFASLKVGELAYVNGITIRDGQNGLWLGMPSRKVANPKEGEKEWQDVFYPASKEVRVRMTEAVVRVYESHLGPGGQPGPAPASRQAPPPQPPAPLPATRGQEPGRVEPKDRPF